MFSSFKRKGGGALTQKLTTDLAKQSVNSGATELGVLALLNVKNNAANPISVAAGGAPTVTFSSASYQAHDPCADRLVLEVSSAPCWRKQHICLSVCTASVSNLHSFIFIYCFSSPLSSAGLRCRARASATG